jgi:hypothetical protein
MKKYLMINAESMGQGDWDLGKTLLKKFLGQIVASDETPTGIALMNSGVKLVCSQSPVLEELQALEKRGTNISSCITCLEFYDLIGDVQVGIQGNMRMYVQYMFDADDTFVIG